MVALAVGFTMFLSALAGFDRVDRRAADLLRSFGAGPVAILWRLPLPTALSMIADGMRISTVRSLVGAIVTEMLGAQGGLGWVIYQAVVQIDFVQVWSAIFAAVMLSKARREATTLRDLYNLTAAARGHWVLCGSAESIADTLELWFTTGAADGFNIMPPYFHGDFEDFVDLVVPILQSRGLFRQFYTGKTLRDHLCLSTPVRQVQ
jgi:hypothetical protein